MNNSKPTTAELLHFHLNINEELPKLVAREYLQSEGPKIQDHHFNAICEFLYIKGLKGTSVKKQEKIWQTLYPNQRGLLDDIDSRNAIYTLRWLKERFPADFDEFPVWL